jgi:type I thyroxine 5'-deiodinase
VLIANPLNQSQRTEAAAACVRGLKIEIPAIVDDFQNNVEAAYSGWPDRLYVIDAAGSIAHKSAPGPYGFKPDEVAATLAKLLPVPR